MTDDRLTRVENDVANLKKTTAVLDERQIRMHEDLGKLTLAIEENTKAQAEFNKFIENKKGFFGGVIATLGVVSGVFGALIYAVWDKLSG